MKCCQRKKLYRLSVRTSVVCALLFALASLGNADESNTHPAYDRLASEFVKAYAPLFKKHSKLILMSDQKIERSLRNAVPCVRQIAENLKIRKMGYVLTYLKGAVSCLNEEKSPPYKLPCLRVKMRGYDADFFYKALEVAGECFRDPPMSKNFPKEMKYVLDRLVAYDLYIDPEVSVIPHLTP